MVSIRSLDHLVLTVADPDRTAAFYVRHLGMEAVTFGEGRRALRFGGAKINLHQAGSEIAPYARRPTPGSADLCFLIDEPVADVRRALRADGIECTAPAPRTGACRPLMSIYLRDPDGNLIELANEL